MEIKLTADWILLHNSEVFCIDSKCYISMYDTDFEFYLTELALESLNVKYEREERYELSDKDFINPFYLYSFENIEDIKDTCPQLYNEFQRSIKEDIEYKEEINIKQNIILKYLDTHMTNDQINLHLEKEFYSKDEDNEVGKSSHLLHTNYLIDDLVKRGLVEKTNNEFVRIKNLN